MAYRDSAACEAVPSSNRLRSSWGGTWAPSVNHLITGGAGFIGSHLADALVARSDRVLILDDLSTGRRENVEHLLADDCAELIEGSTLDERLVDDLMRQADTCFHLASAVGVQLVVERPLHSLLNNVRGTDVVMSAVARHGRRLLFTSTSEIYGKLSDGALREDADRVLGSPSKARWSYATSKAFGEMVAFGYAREHAAETIIVRLFNTVGPRQSGAYGMVLPRFVQQALAGEDLTVFGDGNQTRCFAHVQDVIDGLLRLVADDRAVGSVYNVGSSSEISIRELAQRVIDRSGSGSSIRLVEYEAAYEEGFEELGRRKPDTAAIRSLVGWKPTRTIDHAIDDVIAHERRVAPVGAA